MTTPHLGDSYEFESKNRAECYGADINFYIPLARTPHVRLPVGLSRTGRYDPAGFHGAVFQA